MPITIDDPQDPRVREYVALTDLALRSSREPELGIYLAESEKVIRRALAAGHRPISFLMAPRWLTELADLVSHAEADGVPVFVGAPDVLESLTGFHLHRGALAAMHRPSLPSVAAVLAGARRVAVLEDIVDHTNVGADSHKGLQDLRSTITGARSRIAIFEDVVDHTNLGAAFRSAAALGVGGVLITPRCADPLYRRSIRVSMGAVFQVPWTRLSSWPEDLGLVKTAGYTTVGLALSDGAIDIRELTARTVGPLALIFGTEGDGLAATTVAEVDVVCSIPMSGGVDSLNVAAAAAVVFYATQR